MTWAFSRAYRALHDFLLTEFTRLDYRTVKVWCKCGCHRQILVDLVALEDCRIPWVMLYAPGHAASHPSPTVDPPFLTLALPSLEDECARPTS